jgi:Holliday junction resolvase-like predicted endonuclease
MLETPQRSISFTLDHVRYVLSRTSVESQLLNVEPEAGQKHYVLVNSRWFPVLQALEVALDVPRSRFRSSGAIRHFAALGFELRGEREPRTLAPNQTRSSEPLAAPVVEPELIAGDHVDDGWHTEARVQSVVVHSLVEDGWRILREANTASREHGIDVIAEFDGITYGIEVKGFPSRGYADPRRAAETKRTSPSTQAGHWYSQAMLSAARLRGNQPDLRSVIALPDFNRYRTLVSQTRGSLEASQIEVWWVDSDGQLSKP